MTEADIEQIMQRPRGRFPGVTQRIISDNGPQFLAKEFIRICDMTHMKASPYYLQSNGKIERFHRTIKGDCIRTQTLLSSEDTQRVVARYVEHYNAVLVCTASSARSHPRPSWRAVTRRFWPSGMASCGPLGSGGSSSVKLPAGSPWTANPKSLQRNQRSGWSHKPR